MADEGFCSKKIVFWDVIHKLPEKRTNGIASSG